MIRRLFLLAVLTFATPLVAQSVKLKAHEIEILLSGNTAVGIWQGAAYRQFFNADGSTIYAQTGTRSTVGQWRVDPERDEYQSIWPRETNWEGWYVMEYAGDFFWVSKNTPPTPFTVLEGQQLVAADAIDLRCQAVADWAQEDVRHIRRLVVAETPATCGSSLGLSGTAAQHCAWAFAYRAPEAQEQVARLSARLTACFGAATPTAEPLVNHPDSYALQAFETSRGSVSISLKDKGALQQTYIFLRTERQPD